MNDTELIEGFENCSLPKEGFHHQEHVRVAWIYLRRMPVIEALERFTGGLKRFAAFHGKSDLYHETITWSYIFIINQRIAASPGVETWEQFAAVNSDLLSWENSILTRYYRDQTLASDFAKRIFVFPDKL